MQERRWGLISCLVNRFTIPVVRLDVILVLAMVIHFNEKEILRWKM